MLQPCEPSFTKTSFRLVIYKLILIDLRNTYKAVLLSRCARKDLVLSQQICLTRLECELWVQYIVNRSQIASRGLTII